MCKLRKILPNIFLVLSRIDESHDLTFCHHSRLTCFSGLPLAVDDPNKNRLYLVDCARKLHKLLPVFSKEKPYTSALVAAKYYHLVVVHSLRFYLKQAEMKVPKESVRIIDRNLIFRSIFIILNITNILDNIIPRQFYREKYPQMRQEFFGGTGVSIGSTDKNFDLVFSLRL